MSDIERIFEKLDTQGVEIAKISERTRITSEVVTDVAEKVDKIRTGEWDCPTGKALRAEFDNHTHDKEKKISIKQLSTTIGALIIGVGVGIMGLIKLFGG